MDTTTKKTVYKCPDCSWTGTTDDIYGLLHLHHIDQHISAGELVPAGTCPECRALIEVANADIADYVVDNVVTILRERGWTLIAPDAAQPAEQVVALAYAIYGINGRGEHFLRDVKKIPADDTTGEWKIDDDGLHEYWAGNAPLVELKDAAPASDDPLDMLRACVKAKNDFWACIDALEKKLAPGGDFSDHANDRLVDLIDMLAAGGNSELHAITAEHLAEAVKLAAR